MTSQILFPVSCPASPAMLDRRGNIIKNEDSVFIVDDTRGRPDPSILKRKGVVQKIDVGSRMVTVCFSDGTSDFFPLNRVCVEK